MPKFVLSYTRIVTESCRVVVEAPGRQAADLACDWIEGELAPEDWRLEYEGPSSIQLVELDPDKDEEAKFVLDVAGDVLAD